MQDPAADRRVSIFSGATGLEGTGVVIQGTCEGRSDGVLESCEIRDLAARDEAARR